MKHSHLGALCVVAIVAASGPAVAGDANGSDSMALDQFIAGSLSASDALASGGEQRSMTGGSAFLIAQNGAHMDADGYIIGADGKRIAPAIKPRWRVGVFR